MPFAGRLGGDQDLDLAFAELLLGVQARARFVARARFHAAVDGADAEAPGPQAVDEIVERVLELREEQEPLVGIVEEPLVAGAGPGAATASPQFQPPRPP